MATLVTYNDLNLSNFTSVIRPLPSGVIVSDSGYNATNRSTVTANTVGYVVISGTNFTSSTQVYSRLIGIYNIPKLATSITFINTTQLNVQLQASSAGPALLYVVNQYGTTGITFITYA